MIIRIYEKKKSRESEVIDLAKDLFDTAPFDPTDGDGFLLPDGQLLLVSAEYGHAEIASVYTDEYYDYSPEDRDEKFSDYFFQFMEETGSMRYDVEEGFELWTVPTTDQLESIKKAFDEYGSLYMDIMYNAKHNRYDSYLSFLKDVRKVA